jgi:hypothetical protein
MPSLEAAPACFDFQTLYANPAEEQVAIWIVVASAGTMSQLGRAYVLQGDTAKAKASYQDFLTLWKDADPDIPILKQAKAEYAKLQ